MVVLRVTVTDDQNVPRTEMLTGGEAWVSTGGATVHAAWHKASPTAPIELTTTTAWPFGSPPATPGSS